MHALGRETAISFVNHPNRLERFVEDDLETRYRDQGISSMIVNCWKARQRRPIRKSSCTLLKSESNFFIMFLFSSLTRVPFDGVTT